MLAYLLQIIPPTLTDASSWGTFAEKVGLPTFLLVLMTGCCGFLLWWIFKNPSNAFQVKDSTRRTRIILRCVGYVSEMLVTMSKTTSLSPEQQADITRTAEKIDRLVDDLETDTDNDEDHHGR